MPPKQAGATSWWCWPLIEKAKHHLHKFRTSPKLKGPKAKLLLLKFGNYAVGAIVALVLARFLGAEGYGIYAFVYALVLVLIVPAAAGLPDLVMRETTRAIAAGRPGEVRHVWRWASAVALTSSLVVLFLVFSTTSITGYGPASREAFVLGLLLVPVLAAAAVRASAMQALGYPFQGQMPNMVLRQMLLVICFLAVVLSGIAAPSPSIGLGANLTGALIALALGLILLARVAPTDDGLLKARDAPHKQWLLSSAWMSTGKGAQVLNNNIDILLLGFLATATDVGIYKAALVVGATTLFAVQAIEQAIKPRLVEANAVNRRHELARTSVRAARQIASFGVVAFTLITVFGYLILERAFGADFAEGYWALLIVSIGKLAFVSFGPVRPLLNMTGNEAAIAPVMAQGVVVNVLACLILIPPFGLMGAAAGLLISSWYWNLRLYLLVKARLGIDCSVVGTTR